MLLPLLAGLAMLLSYLVIQVGLALFDQWDPDLARRAADARSHQEQILLARYDKRLREVRMALRRLGYNAGPVDAAMGPRTADALRAFQQRRGLPITGRADAPTMMALGVEP